MYKITFNELHQTLHLCYPHDAPDPNETVICFTNNLTAAYFYSDLINRLAYELGQYTGHIETNTFKIFGELLMKPRYKSF